MKPGWQTTEFWLSLVPILGGILVAAGLLSSSQEQNYETVAKEAVGLIVSAIAAISYARGRTNLKMADK